MVGVETSPTLHESNFCKVFSVSDQKHLWSFFLFSCIATVVVDLKKEECWLAEGYLGSNVLYEFFLSLHWIYDEKNCLITTQHFKVALRNV